MIIHFIYLAVSNILQKTYLNPLFFGISFLYYEMKVNVPYFKHLVQVTFEGLKVLANLYTFLAYVYIMIVQICYCKNVCPNRIENNHAESRVFVIILSVNYLHL